MRKILMHFFTTLFVVLIFTNIANAQNKPSGVPCTASNQCASNYCSNQLPEGKVAGSYLCMAQYSNCPMPGTAGIMFGGQYNFDGAHWYCTRGVGIQRDGVAREPNFDDGKNRCTGFFERIDCRGEWYPLVADGIRVYCATAARDPYSAAFCGAAEVTAYGYDQQR